MSVNFNQKGNIFSSAITRNNKWFTITHSPSNNNNCNQYNQHQSKISTLFTGLSFNAATKLEQNTNHGSNNSYKEQNCTSNKSMTSV